MADGHTAHESVASNISKEGASESHDKKIIVENGIYPVNNHSEESGKGDAGIHDSSTLSEHNHKDAILSSEAKEELTNVNGNDSSFKTSGTDHGDLSKHECSDGKKNNDQEEISEGVEEKTTKEGVSGGNEDLSHDPLTTAENIDATSDDQKPDKTGDQDERESCSHVQVDSNKNEESSTIEKEEHITEKEISTEEFSAEPTQVVDNTGELPDEPNTEAYYTSSFTFVCQKSHEVEEEDEQKWEEDEASGKVEPQEANVTDENVEVVEKEKAQEIETHTYDETTDVTSITEINEVSKSSLVDAEYSESHEDALAGDAEPDYASELSYERTMTSDFQETNDEARNLSESQLDNEKNENESEIDAGVYDSLSNTTDEEKYFPNRAESATPDSDAELRTERIERPNHFAHLKRTGVQKTERPYDSGTTESKIAMEIREMREREEELRIMRERMQSPDSSISSSSSPLLSPTPTKQKSLLSEVNSESPEPGPGYRVSTVFGHKGSPAQPPVEEEKKTYRSFNKESAVEKEIRIARSREEELRKEKGLPPREDDSYIKPSQVKSSQVRVFSKMNAPNTSKELATTKIQQEIEEQTLREMALREKGHIQTISQERTDSKVAKLKDLDISVPECASPTSPNGHGRGSFSDRSSKRSTPSPTGSSHGLIPPVPRPASQAKGISMQKFIASKGKETTFITSRNGPSHPEQNADASRSMPVMRKAKRTVSVESKIQQEILELKLREEELRRMHNSSTEQSFLTSGENGTDLGEPTNDESDYINGQEMNGNDDLGPSSNSLIAQWEQRIQKAEGRA